MKGINRHQLYLDFQTAFPIEKLHDMKLEEYTNLNRKDSFTYWVETKTRPLGSIKGGSSYKFGIFRYNKITSQDNDKYAYDNQYAWYSRLGDNKNIVFDKIKDSIIKVATFASNGEYNKIDDIKDLGDAFKWKIAFLYSHESLINIYDKKWLLNISNLLGGNFNNKSKISDIQKFLLSKRNGKDIFEYGQELWEMREGQKQLQNNQLNHLIPINNPKTWMYAPGDGASEWQRCLDTSTMCLGWDNLGDFSQFKSREDIVKKLQEVENKESNYPNDSLAVWDFLTTLKPGDTVIAKKGLYKILGRGVIEGEYEYDDTLTTYKNIRKVKWINTGEWEAPKQLPQKTLTDITSYTELIQNIEDLFESDDFQPANKNYWWLVANPKYFRFSDIEIGNTVDYTVKTEKGNPRRHAVNFENAKKGDIVIGYEANPVKKIVSVLSVERPSDGKTILFKKIEDLIFPVSWFDFKDIPDLNEMEFLKNRNGSFFKLTPNEYEILFNLMRQDNPEPEDNPISDKQELEKYTDEDFLNEVFMTEDELENLKLLLRQKKNIILQGAPGVGKSFTAKRLAYAMMGEKDKSRVELVQFHQNYSYEDFIMGYKPNEKGGFDLDNGIFYDFCAKASSHPSKEYFFIIDEINRGNLSKIFGELLMLIEKDYRGKTQIRLPYNKQLFSIPENLYIIGMMNTADRSLALIDYALRRRFKFYTMKPGFETTSFKEQIDQLSDERVSKVIDAVIQLNKKISEDDSLGEGFCIGHSYFCNPENEKSWLDNIVKFEICPMLDEYWFDDKDKRETEKQRFINLLK